MTPKHRSIGAASRRAVGFAALSLAALLLSAAARAQPDPLREAPGPSEPARPGPGAGRREEWPGQATVPSATAIIRSLAPFADRNPNGGRDVRDVVIDGGRRVRVDYAHAVDITVFFAYDSARLTPEARIQLEPLGRALQSPELLPYPFLIAGHTDAAGSPSYNRMLSLRRASAVRDHLVRTYGIDPRRLLIHGWGPTQLKDPGDPLSSVNRRVEVALIETKRLSSYRDLPPPVVVAGPRLDDRIVPCAGERPDDPRLRTWQDLDDFDTWPTVLCPASQYPLPPLGARRRGWPDGLY